VAALRAALLLPTVDELGQCVAGLVEAAQSLGSVEQGLRSGEAAPDGLRSDLDGLKNELRRVHALIEQGAAFHSGLAKLLGSATAGYTPSGAAAPLTPAGALSVQG